MKLPSLRKILTSDFEDEIKAVIEKLANSINYNFERLWTIVNGKITFDNTAWSVKDITVTVNSSGVPTETIGFTSTSNPARPIGSVVIDVQNLTNPTSYPTSGVFVSYSESNGQVTINHITGLTSGNKYKLKIIFFS